MPRKFLPTNHRTALKSILQCSLLLKVRKSQKQFIVLNSIQKNERNTKKNWPEDPFGFVLVFWKNWGHKKLLSRYSDLWDCLRDEQNVENCLELCNLWSYDGSTERKQMSLAFRRSSAMYNLRSIFLKWHTNHMQTNENPIWKCTYCFNRSCLFFSRMLFFLFSVFCYLFFFYIFETISWKSCSKQVWKKPILFFWFHCFWVFHYAHLQKFDLFLRLV